MNDGRGERENETHFALKGSHLEMKWATDQIQREWDVPVRETGRLKR
jgi:hypothetical protein